MSTEVEALQALGLTLYQTRAYLALVRKGPAKAEDVAAAAGVPATKVHKVLKDLQNQCWVDSDEGRPRVYRALDPTRCIERDSARIHEGIDRAKERLAAEFKAGSEQYSSPFWILHGEEEGGRRTIDMVRRARRNLFLANAFPLAVDGGALPKAIKAAVNRGVRVQIMIGEGQFLHDAYTGLGIEVRTSPMPFRFVSMDDQQVLIGYIVEEGSGSTVTSIWHPDTQVTKLLGSAMPRLWNSAAVVTAQPA